MAFGIKHSCFLVCGLLTFFQHIMSKLNMKHEKHAWFIRDSNPVSLGQKSGALTTELPRHPNDGFIFVAGPVKNSFGFLEHPT
jgi:hypothetical protein